MIGQPKYTEGDHVQFTFDGQVKTGTIEIVDAYGAFFDESDVSYDILIEEENTLYKHIREDRVIKNV